MTQPKRAKYETASCAGCGRPFERLTGRSNPKAYCDAENCQKIKRIKNTVARFSDLPDRSPTIYTADIDYHGKPLY